MQSDSIDSLITDPPAGISFMGKKWDTGNNFIPDMTKIFEECLRVLKPGAHGLVWALPKTSHWTMTALENAGFEVRDVITHLFGTGFPKSLDISKAIDKAAGAERAVVGPGKWNHVKGTAGKDGGITPDGYVSHGGVKTQETVAATEEAKQWQGWGTALKPACEFWVLVRKPCSEKTVAANVKKHGTGGINIDACRVEGTFQSGWAKSGSKSSDNLCMSGANTAREPKPDNPQGRFPANLVLDEEAAKALDEQSGELKGPWGKDSKQHVGKDGLSSIFKLGGVNSQNESRAKETGGASRFFMVFNNTCGLEKTEVDDTFVGRKAENKSVVLSTDGCGNNTSGLFLPIIISTTKIKTHLTTTFQIWNVCTKTSIGTCTIESASAIDWLATSSIESVSFVNNTEVLINFRSEQQELIRVTARIVQESALNNGEQKIVSTTMPTIENIEQNNSRFFYCAKSSKSDRGEDNHHPTVKSTKLMEYLIKLITPPNGVVLDPFMGSGSTVVAAKRLGHEFVGIEREQDYFDIAVKRIELSGNSG